MGKKTLTNAHCLLDLIEKAPVSTLRYPWGPHGAVRACDQGDGCGEAFVRAKARVRNGTGDLEMRRNGIVIPIAAGMRNQCPAALGRRRRQARHRPRWP